MTTQQSIAAVLKAARKEKGLTQLQVAHALGHVFSDRVSNWEKGKGAPNITNFFKLCDIFGKTPEEMRPIDSRPIVLRSD